jgi:hypothetical protein
MGRVSMIRFLLFFLLLVSAPGVFSQQTAADATREKTRERLRQLLDRLKVDTKVTFKQGEKQPFNFLGILKEGLTNSDSFEIVVSVTPKDTIGFRIFPHYKGGYINVDKVKNAPAMMKQLLQLNDRTFLFWGADESGDVFIGYTFTLESGFPDEAIRIVLASIANMDKFIGELKPNIDGSSAP